MNVDYILFGNMCSGKTSVARILKNEFNYSIISARDVIIKNLETADESVKELRKKGSLLPDDVIINWVFNEINKINSDQKSLVLDGFPRTDIQAKEVIKVLHGVIHGNKL